MMPWTNELVFSIACSCLAGNTTSAFRRSAVGEHCHVKQKSSSGSSTARQSIGFEGKNAILSVILIWKLLTWSKGASSLFSRAAAAIGSAQPGPSPRRLQTTNKSKVFWSPDFLWDLPFADPSRSFGTPWAPVRMAGVKQIAGLREHITSSERHTAGRADSPRSAAKAGAPQLTATLLVNTDSRFLFYFLFFPHTQKCLPIPFGRWI